MTVRRNSKDQLVVTLSGKLDPVEVQRMLHYLHYLELTAGTKATPAQAEALAKEASSNIRRKRRKRLAA